MTKLAEYREVTDENRAKRAAFSEAYSQKVRANVAFSYVSHGWEPAGSVARWTDGYYSVRWMDHTGAYQGRRYLLTEQGRADAKAHFDRLTGANQS